MTRSGHEIFTASPGARVLSHGGALIVVGPGGSAHQASGDSADLLRALLAFIDRPRTRQQILDHVTALAGGALESPDVVDEALALLASSGALLPLEAMPAPRQAPPRGRLLLCVSGAVSAAWTPELVTRLQHAGFTVRAALTREARRFVSPRVLEALTHAPVFHSLWQRSEALPVPHVNLAEWAELVLICPASATTISRIAAGDCSDLVSAIAVGTRAPLVVAPSMNPAMLGSPQVQRNLHLLAEDGAWLVQGGAGEELAHPPAERAPLQGAMPLASALVDLACFVGART